MEPPSTVSGASCFIDDVTIGNVTFPKDLGFILLFWVMHMDPTEWAYPTSFIPDRFDSTSPYFKRPDGAKRNSLSFTPFLGGKRVCLGKSFAEITTRHTLPLLFHYIDFQFSEAGQGYIPYHMGQVKTPEIFYNCVVKRLPKFK